MIDSREGAHPPTLTIDYTLATPPPPPPTLAIAAPASKAEGNSGSTAFTFTVTRSGDTTGATTVDYTVTGRRHQCGQRGRLRRQRMPPAAA